MAIVSWVLVHPRLPIHRLGENPPKLAVSSLHVDVSGSIDAPRPGSSNSTTRQRNQASHPPVCRGILSGPCEQSIFVDLDVLTGELLPRDSGVPERSVTSESFGIS